MTGVSGYEAAEFAGKSLPTIYHWNRAAQLQMFRLLGTPPDLKRDVVFETGHAIPRNDLIRETLGGLVGRRRRR